MHGLQVLCQESSVGKLLEALLAPQGRHREMRIAMGRKGVDANQYEFTVVAWNRCVTGVGVCATMT